MIISSWRELKEALIVGVAFIFLLAVGESLGLWGGVKPPDISIQRSARTGNIEAVKQHLAAGTDVNAKGAVGLTPLQGAAFQGHKEIVELLIANGAELNAQSDGGNTPLDLAIMAGTPEVSDLLRKHGGKTGEELKAEGK